MSASGRTRRSMRLSTDEKPTTAPCSWSARAMPHAIEWSLATPKISAFLPSSSPIASSQGGADPRIGPRIAEPGAHGARRSVQSCTLPRPGVDAGPLGSTHEPDQRSGPAHGAQRCACPPARHRRRLRPEGRAHPGRRRGDPRARATRDALPDRDQQLDGRAGRASPAGARKWVSRSRPSASSRRCPSRPPLPRSTIRARRSS